MAKSSLREQVEWVFGLTGGELNDKSLRYHKTDEDSDHQYGFAFYYDGVPSYARPDFEHLDENHYDYFTAVSCELYGSSLDELITVEDGKLYKKLKVYTNSGETECPGKSDGDGVVTEEQADPSGFCPYCDESIGDEHGYIYLGDGWCEVVYMHDGIQHMRDLASQHNLNIWQEPAWEVFHSSTPANGCDIIEIPKSLAELTNINGCPECGLKYEGNEDYFIVEPGKSHASCFWWQCCSPGCLPEGPPTGPFTSEVDALEDATQGLE